MPPKRGSSAQPPTDPPKFPESPHFDRGPDLSHASASSPDPDESVPPPSDPSSSDDFPFIDNPAAARHSLRVVACDHYGLSGELTPPFEEFVQGEKDYRRGVADACRDLSGMLDEVGRVAAERPVSSPAWCSLTSLKGQLEWEADFAEFIDQPFADQLEEAQLRFHLDDGTGNDSQKNEKK